MTTQKEIRNEFWESFPEFKPYRRTRKTQNDYPAAIRVTFVNFVDNLARSRQISEALADRVTL